MIFVKKLVLILSIFMFFLVSGFGANQVQVFSTYDSTIKINNDETIDVNKHIELQNRHVVGIVPGRVEFKIGKKVEGSVSDIDVSDIKVTDRYNQPINYQIFDTENEAVIALDIFLPLLPGFKYIINLEYTVSYDSSGLLFKNIEFPISEDTSIPIEKGTFTLEVPEGKKFTYLNVPDTDFVIEDNIATWGIDRNSPAVGQLEYSSIPIYINGVKGSYVFWFFMNFLLIIILIVEIFRGIRNLK